MKDAHLTLPDPQAVIGQFPPFMARAVRYEWLRRRQQPAPAGAAEADAGHWLATLASRLPASGLPLNASDDALCEFADQAAAEGALLRVRGASLAEVAEFCHQRGVGLPAGDSVDSITRRAGCPLWWRRNLRRHVARRTEMLAIRLGLVHKRAGLYASHDTLHRRRAQKRRNSALLTAMQAVNELGDSFTLAELADKSTANPALRRAELMTRIAGFEYIARAMDMAGEFVTLTAPGRFHPVYAKGGRRNARYDGSSPLDAHLYLGRVWRRITAALARAGIRIFGFRVVEPHHDGTPHFHGLFFLRRPDVTVFRRIVARHAVREDREELGLHYCLTREAAMDKARQLQAAGQPGSRRHIAARLRVEADFWARPPRRVWWAIRARVFFKAINWRLGTAAGYIAKYIAKNIDGQQQDGRSLGMDYEAAQGEVNAVATAERVDAWAACWGIRQFQQVGGPPVGVWRELRRWDYTGAEDVLMLAAVAADAGNWGRFMEVMGGYEARRKDMPLRVARDMAGPNRYGEQPALPSVVFGVVEVASGVVAKSRVHEWTISNGRPAPAWTGVNNSTKSIIERDIVIDRAQLAQVHPEEWVAFKLATEEQERYERIRPLDDRFVPPDQLARQQGVLRSARVFFEEQQALLRQFSQLIDEWVGGHHERALARRDLEQRQVVGRALYKRAAKTPGRGLEVIADARIFYLNEHARLEREAAAPPGRWHSGGSSLPIAVQLAQATAAARRWVADTDPDATGVLTLGDRHHDAVSTHH